MSGEIIVGIGALSAIVRPLKEIQTNIIIQYYSHVLKRRGEALKAKSCSGLQVNHKCAGRCQQDILLKGFIAFVLIFCQQANHMCVSLHMPREGMLSLEWMTLKTDCLVLTDGP